MKYVKMTIEEANKIAKKDAVVYVATSDLEQDEFCDAFEKKRFGECENIIKEAETIAKMCDGFASQLRLFTVEQEDIINYEPRGKLSTILFKEQDRK